MSTEHKTALAVGREESRAVRRYLEALETHRPKRGRQRTPDSITKRIAAIDNQLATSDPLTRVRLIQERFDLADELSSKEEPVDLEALETDFISAAASYAQRKGLTYTAWREVGVPADVLKRAGIARTRN